MRSFAKYKGVKYENVGFFFIFSFHVDFVLWSGKNDTDKE